MHPSPSLVLAKLGVAIVSKKKHHINCTANKRLSCLQAEKDQLGYGRYARRERLSTRRGEGSISEGQRREKEDARWDSL